MNIEKVALIIAIILGLDYYQSGDTPKINSPSVQEPEVQDDTPKSLRVKAVIFTANWCPPCVYLHNTLDTFKSQGWTDGPGNINPLEYSYQEKEETLHHNNTITIYPTVIYFVDGKEYVRLNGETDALKIVNKWNEINREIERK